MNDINSISRENIRAENNEMSGMFSVFLFTPKYKINSEITVKTERGCLTIRDLTFKINE